MKEFPRKFLSLRDKGAAHRRSKSVPPGEEKSRPLSIFRTDHSKSNAKDDVEDVETTVDEVQRRLGELQITNISAEHIKAIMATKFAEGDPEKTVAFIDIEQKAAAGTILPYNPNVHMVGAENREGVTCYLDALLFAMFSKLDAFECMLQVDFPQEDHRARLVGLLRVWVNMLRTGKLVRTDMTKLLQDSLADCGWSDARLLEQQDTSEAFAFLTETLQLPLLSLQVDLFHDGKKDVDDHKVVYERLLNLAVPPDSEGKGIKLEDCLEEYFNAQVDVSRDSEEGKKPTLDDTRRDSATSLSQKATLRLITSSDGDASSSAAATPLTLSPTPVARLPSYPHGIPKTDLEADISQTPVSSTLDTSVQGQSSLSPTDVSTSPEPLPQIGEDVTADDISPLPQDTKAKEVPTSAVRPPTRHRSTSIIQRVMIDEQGRTTSADEETLMQRAKRKGSTVVKAVTIPAWQFFRLIPWHAASSEEPRTNVEVALNFDQKPVVGICLKRYAMTETGLPKRHNTYIDIPDSMRLPHFMLAGENADEEAKDLNMDYKLVLQSVVCHRGDSLQSGHYIAFARVAPKLLTDNRRHDFDPPPDYEEAQWVRFDDLDLQRRVSYVDDIREALKIEMPYLLFYQVVPIMDATNGETKDAEPGLPTYAEARKSMEMPPITEDIKITEEPQQKEDYFDRASVALQSNTPSIRLSTDIDTRESIDITGRDSYATSLVDSSNRQSLALDDLALATPSLTPDGPSPSVTPTEESTASRLSRAAQRFSRGRQSRTPSQSGENRTSTSGMSRLGTLIRASREQLAEQNAAINTAGPPISDTSNTAGSSPVEVEHPQLPTSHTHGKNGSKRTRSKDKFGKHQPERECLVM